jgi:hypothetical protein
MNIKDIKVYPDETKLRDLKVGDHVCFHGGGFSSRVEVKTVERVTKTQIIVQGSTCKYRRDGGGKVSASQWDSGRISVITERTVKGIIEQVKRAKVDNCITALENFKNVPSDELIRHLDEITRLIEEERS